MWLYDIGSPYIFVDVNKYKVNNIKFIKIGVNNVNS